MAQVGRGQEGRCCSSRGPAVGMDIVRDGTRSCCRGKGGGEGRDQLVGREEWRRSTIKSVAMAAGWRPDMRQQRSKSGASSRDSLSEAR